MSTFGSSLCNIICGRCGHEADVIAFTRSAISGDFPPGHFQCPNCRDAWRVVKTPLVYGKFQPPNKIERIAPRL